MYKEKKDTRADMDKLLTVHHPYAHDDAWGSAGMNMTVSLNKECPLNPVAPRQHHVRETGHPDEVTTSLIEEQTIASALDLCHLTWSTDNPGDVEKMNGHHKKERADPNA
jgi:hypothetical protein